MRCVGEKGTSEVKNLSLSINETRLSVNQSVPGGRQRDAREGEATRKDRTPLVASGGFVLGLILRVSPQATTYLWRSSQETLRPSENRCPGDPGRHKS
jgi:hypothetical protein